jgi:hypothetical protein
LIFRAKLVQAIGSLASKQPPFAVGVGVLHLAFPFQDDPCPAVAGPSFLAGGTNRRAAELL